MDQVSMQLYAKEKIASARAQADIQRELDNAKKPSNFQLKLGSRLAIGIKRMLALAAGRLRQTIILIPSQE